MLSTSQHEKMSIRISLGKYAKELRLGDMMGDGLKKGALGADIPFIDTHSYLILIHDGTEAPSRRWRNCNLQKLMIGSASI